MISVKNSKKYVRTLMFIIIVLVTLAVYVIQSSRLNNIISDQDKTISELEQQLTLLEEVIENSETTAKADDSVEQKQEDVQQTLDLPFIKYVPGGLFDDDEKRQLQEKLLDPFFDFNGKDNYVAVIIEKIEGADNEGDFKFDVQILNKNGSYGGFLYGEGDRLEWWLPDCLDGCTFTDEFQEKYPELVEEYNN